MIISHSPASKLLVGIAASSLWVSIVYADGALPGYYQDPGLNPNRSTVNHNDDEHVDPFTGMLQLHHLDMSWPGNGGFDLVLQRSYNSPSAAFGSTSDTMSWNRTPNVGVGWNLLIGGRAFNAVGTAGACNTTQTQFTYEGPDGSRQGMIKQADGTFLSPARWRGVCNPNGVQIFSPDGTRYDLYQTIWEAIPATLNSTPFAYPTHIQDRNGNSADFTYGTLGGGAIIVPAKIITSDSRELDFFYSQLGNIFVLTSVQAGSRSWTFSYYATPVVTEVGTGAGLAYDLAGVAPPAGGSWSYFYNPCSPGQAGSCALIGYYYPEGGSVGYTYSLVSFQDGSGNSSVVTKKQVSGVYILGQTLNGYTWLFNYAPGTPGQHDITTVTLPSGAIITYEHIGAGAVAAGTTWQTGLLVKKTQQNSSGSGAAQVETYTWDKQQIAPFPTSRQFGLSDGVTYAPVMTQHVVTRVGPSYTTTYSNFDAYGNPQQIDEVGQRSHTITRAYYIDTNKWILHTPANESTTGLGNILRGFDANGNLLSENRYGVTTSYTYLSDGSLGTKTDANSQTTTYSLYYRGTAQLEQRPASVTINRTVDDAGNILTQTDGAGNTYNYSYDGIRRMIGKTPPIGNPTGIVWAGSTQRTATRGSYVETLSLDGVANPYLLTRDTIQTTTFYDERSNKVFESYPGGVTDLQGGGFSSVGTLLTRDVLGRVTQITNSDGSFRTLNDSSFAMVEEDENNHATTYTYSAFGDPDKRFLVGITRADNTSFSMPRDDLGNLLSVTSGSVTRTYQYNGSYFLTSITDPETGVTSFGRDGVGNMTSRTVGSKTTNFVYDGLNRLTTINYPSSGSVTITYFGNGRTASVTNSAATRSYTYDANANLLTETLTVGGQTFTTTYTYNGNDALATITYPRTGEVVTYSPDNLGRPTQAAPYATSVSYFPSGNTKQIVYASGVTADMTEDGRLRPDTLNVGWTGQTWKFIARGYKFDATNNMLKAIDAVDPHQSLQMSYDNINQLTSASGPWGTGGMSYDPVGNITALSLSGQGPIYTYDASNKLSVVSGKPFSYDVYGNVTNDGNHTYQYDDASNMTCVDCGTGNEIDYAYDGNNRRVSRAQRGITTYYVHAANGDLLLEYTPSSNVTLEHIYLNGKRVATKKLP